MSGLTTPSQRTQRRPRGQQTTTDLDFPHVLPDRPARLAVHKLLHFLDRIPIRSSDATVQTYILRRQWSAFYVPLIWAAADRDITDSVYVWLCRMSTYFGINTTAVDFQQAFAAPTRGFLNIWESIVPQIFRTGYSGKGILLH